MKKEIEAKIRIDSFDSVINQLVKHKAVEHSRVVQNDTFYDTGSGDLKNAHCGLRIRRQKAHGMDQYFLTYKGPKEEGPYKIRPESEIEISDADGLGIILKCLGYNEVLVFEKKRDIWILDNCEICLDEVAMLGRFIEVEGPDPDIVRSVLEKLGLAEYEHINNGYASMVRKKLKHHNCHKSEALFDDK